MLPSSRRSGELDRDVKTLRRAPLTRSMALDFEPDALTPNTSAVVAAPGPARWRGSAEDLVALPTDLLLGAPNTLLVAPG